MVQMYNIACVVNVYQKSHQLNQGTCCGILLGSDLGFVLAHASCLGPFLEQGVLDFGNSIALSDVLQNFECEVLLQKTDKEKGLGRLAHLLNSCPASVQAYHQTNCHKNRELKASREFFAYSRFSAKIIETFQCHTLLAALQELLPVSSWELYDRKDAKLSLNNNNHPDSDSKLEDMQELLSRFIVLKLNDWVPYISALHIRPTKECCIGDRVEICSTPFGGLKPDIFINSYSQGIVSNLAGKDNCLLLSDARCILGGEGAPLYTFQQDAEPARCLTAVVITSMSWKNEEWVGFCFACDISAVMQSLSPRLKHLGFSSDMTKTGVNSSALTMLPYGLMQFNPEVVMLQLGPTWGSGVVIDSEEGIILTCSHVVKDAHLYPVQTKRVGETQRTDVLYRQHPMKHQFDLAVVKCPHIASYKASDQGISTALAVEGLKVLVIGHALFGLKHDLQPSVTAGVVSKVISINKVPVMIQTTCAVHPGASGGALVDTRGRLLGIVVCNAKDIASGASFPHINMSIPVHTVWPLISKYICTGGSVDWLGHVRRMEDGRIPKDMLYGELVAGKRSTGRPQLRYKDVCKRDMKAVDINTNSWEDLAADHSVWRSALHQQIRSGEDRLCIAADAKRAQRKETRTSVSITSTYVCDI